jgi:hypothetical protein
MSDHINRRILSTVLFRNDRRHIPVTFHANCYTVIKSLATIRSCKTPQHGPTHESCQIYGHVTSAEIISLTVSVIQNCCSSCLTLVSEMTSVGSKLSLSRWISRLLRAAPSTFCFADSVANKNECPRRVSSVAHHRKLTDTPKMVDLLATKLRCVLD